MIETKTIGELIDQLIIINMRAWFAQEDLMNGSLPEAKRLEAAVNAQRFNVKRNALIQAIDKKLGEKTSVESKSYE